MSQPGAPKEEKDPFSEGAILWICGVPATGKSTLAAGLVSWLRGQERATLWLDSDDLRPVLTPFAGYDIEGRDAFYAAIGHIALLGAGGGSVVIVSATANRRSYREQVREAAENFVEIALTADEDVLRSDRDVKGLYARSDSGEIQALPGVDVKWEESGLAELTLDTTSLEPDKVLRKVCDWLEESGRLEVGKTDSSTSIADPYHA